MTTKSLYDKVTNEVLDILRQSPLPIRRHEIAKLMEIDAESEEYDLLQDVLEDLEKHGVIEKFARRKYALKSYQDNSSIKGILVIEHKKSYVQTDVPEFPKISVKQTHLNTALSGDEVIVKLLALKKRKKPQGEIVEIVSRNQMKFAGTIEFDGYFHFVVPDDESIYVDFLVPKELLKSAEPGDKVNCKFVSWEHQTKSPHAEVVEIIGKAGEAKAEFDSILTDFNLPEKFPDKVVQEARSKSLPDVTKKYPGRLDVQKDLIITIDPHDAKDFDDALSLKILNNGNYYLGVHIADVSFYVEENTELDIEARIRGNSTYLVDRVIPMLPEELSNELCSLKPNEPRFAYSCYMEISPNAQVVDYKITETIINSKRRYTYDEVLEIIQTGEGDNKDLILSLHKLSRLLRDKRYQAGGIEFDTMELRYVLDEQKNPVEVKMKRANHATQLVEECMLIANKVVATHIEKAASMQKLKNVPFLYRVHDNPDPTKLEDALNFIKQFGVKTRKKNLTSHEINRLLEEVNEMPEKDIIHSVLIRSQAKAEYSTKNIGHYGLGFKYYSHFTSPIRRYADLIVHRMLKEYHAGKVSPDRMKWLNILMKDVAHITTDRERAAMEAERASNKVAGAMMMEKHIGEEFNGIITGVTSFGIFVQVDGIYAEGLIHMKDMHDDYYLFEEKKMRLVGKRHKKILHMGKRIRVRVLKVLLEKRAIDFELVDDKPYETDIIENAE